VDTPSKIFTKLVNKNAINPEKVYPPPKVFTALIYHLPRNLAKTSWTLPLDFQTVHGLIADLIQYRKKTS
jgi:hypothetical protein